MFVFGERFPPQRQRANFGRIQNDNFRGPPRELQLGGEHFGGAAIAALAFVQHDFHPAFAGREALNLLGAADQVRRVAGRQHAWLGSVDRLGSDIAKHEIADRQFQSRSIRLRWHGHFQCSVLAQRGELAKQHGAVRAAQRDFERHGIDERLLLRISQPAMDPQRVGSRPVAAERHLPRNPLR